MSKQIPKAYEEALRRLAVNFNRRLIKDQIITIYQEVSWIPNEAWPEIAQYAIEEWEKWPMNIAKALKHQWGEWLNRNRDKRAKKAQYMEQCEVCGGEGLIFGSKPDESGVNYTYAFRCGHCTNWDGKYSNLIKRKTLQQLQEEGDYEQI